MRILTDEELADVRRELEHATSYLSGWIAKELRTELAIVCELQDWRAGRRTMNLTSGERINAGMMMGGAKATVEWEVGP